MAGQTLRSLVVSVSAETSAYQREMARASRMGANYMRTIGDGNRQAASGWRAQQAAIQAQNGALSQLTAGAGNYARAMLGALAVGNAVAEADNWGQVASRLKMATSSQEEYRAVSEKLMEISDRTYKRYSDQAELFITSAKRMKDLGYSTEVTTAFVDVLASGLTVSAANAEDTASVIKSMSEAIGIGKLQGDQWQATLTKAPAVIEAMASALGVTQAQLEKMARSGELVTSKWLPALISKQQELADKTESMPTTVGDAFQRMGNHYARWLGEQNEAAGVTQNLADLINLLTDNLDAMAVAVVGVAAGGLTKYAAESAKAVLAEIMAVRASIAANIGRAKAQADVAAAAVRLTQAELASAQAHAQAARHTDAHTAALSRLRLAKLADKEASLAQAAAQAAQTRAASLGARAAAGIAGVLSGPAGLALLAAGTAASFLLFADNSEKASTAAVDLKRPITELREEWEKLDAVQRRPVLNALVMQQAEAKKAATSALAEIGRLSSAPDKWGQNYGAGRNTRVAATQQFGTRVRGGMDIDQATQQLIAAVQPTEALRQKIEEWAAAYAEAVRNGHASGEQLGTLTDVMNQGAAAAGTLAAGLSGIQSLSPDMAGAWEKKIDALAERAAKLKDATALGEVNRGITTDGLEATPEGKALADRARAAAAAADAQDKANKAAEEAARIAKQRTEEAKRNAQQLQDAHTRTLSTLQQQVAMYGKTTELAKVRYDTTMGELKGLSAAQKTELERAAAAKDALDAQQAYKALMDGAQTAEERLVSQMRERVRLLNEARAAGGVTPEQYRAATDKFSKASVTKAPSFGGIDASVGGAAGELIKVAEAGKELEKWRSDELERQRAFLDEKLINEEQHAARVAEITEENNTKLASLGDAYRSATLGMFSDVTGQAADMMKQLAGEGSAAYKIMFIASKAAAIAQAVVNTEVAATKALSIDSTGVMAGIVRGLGYASVGMIAATTIAGIAHDGIDNIPREGTWLLDQGERVVDRRTNGDLKAFLAKQPAANDGGGGSGPRVQVSIHISSDGGAQVETPPGLEQFGAELGQYVETQYRKLEAASLRPGGTIYRQMKGRG
ncbi:tape measure protein [Stutzerimonas stutzeri]|uniref:tape measure protein n=1 Tax=Stutzerimonas stutzeri TaxID=316 RepID=UPI00210AF718|nr:tape measure protein [Stutzerimonas stutzeri]MCQ4257478.1 tape measure protein [Stutzerimonas stutzeri]